MKIIKFYILNNLKKQRKNYQIQKFNYQLITFYLI